MNLMGPTPISRFISYCSGSAGCSSWSRSSQKSAFETAAETRNSFGRSRLSLSAATVFTLVVLPLEGHAIAEPKHGLCSDYGSRTDYTGRPYHVRDPEDGRVLTWHQGMDFCAEAETNVLAAADGLVHWVILDNPVRGGHVIIRARLKGPKPDSPEETIFIRALHIYPDPHLSYGMNVRAGTVIGTVQKARKEQIGPRSHVHFDMGRCVETWTCPIDPNDFWRDGQGKITCFDPGNPPPANKLVAPVPCAKD